MARGQRKITTKAWTGAVQPSALLLGATQTVLLAIGISEDGTRETLLRSRGNILVAGTPDAATDVEVVGLGIVVVHSNAATIGGLSVPGPIADDGADWLWHQYVPLDAVTLTAGDPNARSVIHRVEIDSKAMRRIPPDYSAILVGELTTTSFANVSVMSGMRMLFGH